MAAAEEVYVNLNKLLAEINDTEKRLASEEKSYESQMKKTKEVYEDMVRNF